MNNSTGQVIIKSKRNKKKQNIEEKNIIELKQDIEHKNIIDIYNFDKNELEIKEKNIISNKENLNKLLLYLKTNLSNDDLQDLSNKCNAINTECKGDGCGLTSGSLIDMMISKFFKSKLNGYKECRKGEADMYINNILLSQKKINGKSSIALDWSKNKKENTKEKFTCNIMIINLKSGEWYKNQKKSENLPDDYYNKNIPAGIFLINKDYCKDNIILTSNNKTNSFIDNMNLYRMLMNSIESDLYIKLPPINKILNFNIMNSFSE